jgi:hypothetical protein
MVESFMGFSAGRSADAAGEEIGSEAGLERFELPHEFGLPIQVSSCGSDNVTDSLLLLSRWESNENGVNEIPVECRNGCGCIKPFQPQMTKKVGAELGVIPVKIFYPEACVVGPEGSLKVISSTELALPSDYNSRALDHRRVVVARDTRRGHDRNNAISLFLLCDVKPSLQRNEIAQWTHTPGLGGSATEGRFKLIGE